MITSFLTGVAGFIGSHVADHLLAMGHMVIGIDNLSGGFTENIPKGAQFIKADVRDEAMINRLFRDHLPDYVFHLAAYAAEGLSHHIRRYNYEVNLIGSVNLINVAVNVGTVKRFVFTSSNAIYGPHTDFVSTPIDPYGVAKLAVEQDLLAAHNYYDLDYTIFRPHNVYGERQNLTDPYRNVVGIFMRQALRGEPFTVFGDGKQKRPFTYIDDVAPYIARCIEDRSTLCATIDIGTQEQHTILEAAQMIAHLMDVKLDVRHLPARHEAQTVWGSSTYCPANTLFVDGLTRMASWARTQTLREPNPFTAIEIEKNLPGVWKEYAK